MTHLSNPIDSFQPLLYLIFLEYNMLINSSLKHFLLIISMMRNTLLLPPVSLWLFLFSILLSSSSSALLLSLKLKMLHLSLFSSHSAHFPSSVILISIFCVPPPNLPTALFCLQTLKSKFLVDYIHLKMPWDGDSSSFPQSCIWSTCSMSHSAKLVT